MGFVGRLLCTDNDGATNDVDMGYTADNGGPEAPLDYAPVNIVASGELTPVTFDPIKLGFTDAKSNKLIYEIITNSSQSEGPNSPNTIWEVIKESRIFMFPEGTSVLYWRAIDESGNIGGAYHQLFNIFSSIGFARKEMLTGEQSSAWLDFASSGIQPGKKIGVKLALVPSETIIDAIDTTGNVLSQEIDTATDDYLQRSIKFYHD